MKGGSVGVSLSPSEHCSFHHQEVTFTIRTSPSSSEGYFHFCSSGRLREHGAMGTDFTNYICQNTPVPNANFLSANNKGLSRLNVSM